MSVMRRFSPLVFLFLLPPLFADSSADTIRLEPVEGSRVKKGIVSGLIDADPETIFSVITDYEHYTEFMPRTAEATVRERTANRVLFFSHLDMPWPIQDVAYDCEAKFGAGRRSVEFSMVPGTGKGVKRFHGSWQIDPVPGAGPKTQVTYTLLFEPETGYAPWLFDLGTKHSLAKVIGAVRKRVDLKKPPKS
jgi:ribosome-associated toxin RatA of RatAB toxin-antitoxin module